MSCHIRLPNFEFEKAAIDDAVTNGRLLSMEIEFSLKCNFKCPYCYIPDSSYFKNELREEEIKDVILQAKELGARKIIILGGEPMVYPKIFEMIEFIIDHGMSVEMFTNGYGIDAETAKRLFALKVNVVLKMNTFKKEVQDKLAGKQGAFEAIQLAFNNLKSAGYPSDDPFMAVSTIICKDNIEELPEFWRWLRDQGILPYLEMITPQGEASKNDWLEVEPKRVGELFETISLIDREEYGQVWDPQPPLVSNSCLRHRFSCLVNSQGNVMPCVGVPLPVGNIRQHSLKDIIADSEVIDKLRNFKGNIKGPCSQCEKAEACYGCRGAAFNLTGDYLASDPLCWKNCDKQDEIVKLPMSVDSLIPHERPMQIIDTLISVGERKAKASVAIEDDNLFVDEKNILDPAALPEMVAQSIAAMNGFLNMAKEEKSEGFLLGIKSFHVYREVKVGELLTIEVFKAAKLGEFGIIEGKIFSADHLVAEGEIKVWHK